MTNTKLLKMLNISEFTQIGLVVKNISKTIEYYEKYLGLEPFIRPLVSFFNVFYYEERVNSQWILAFSSIGNIEIELIQPLSKPTVYHDFLKEKGEGIHHIGFDIQNIEDKINICKKYGITIMQRGEREGGKFVYLDTRALGGFIIELIQRDNKFIKK
ncbi:MAG: VOC family protein [Candidatus Caldatribacteriota bacterium]